ncbi:hypothetical protein DQ354_13195 [Arthrobacter sp. AQ5-06]|nr:hypothetical protein DQ354_13195 [Arthrobacter sp. AQ5-06]
MDPIRATWESPDEVVAETYSHVFVETLMSLAFGRNIVVQQSAALDSYAFQQVLLDFKRAHDDVVLSKPRLGGKRPAPVMLHLFNADSFAESVAKSLGSMAPVAAHNATASGQALPFESSMYSDLRGNMRLHSIADEIRSGSINGFMHLIGSERASLFEGVWEWFGAARRNSPDRLEKVIQASPAPHIGVPAMLAPILDPSSDFSRRLEGNDYNSSPTVQSLVTALRELDQRSAANDAFANRSRLYGPWPWDEASNSAEDTVGLESLTLVREVINTMYNRVIVDSIGIASASYSTAMGDPNSVGHEFAAQQLALESYDFAVRSRDCRHGTLREGDQTLSGSHVRISGAQEGPRSSVMKLFEGNRATEAFRAVLEIREDQRWKSGIKRIDQARHLKDQTAIDDAVDAHIDVVARALSGKCVFDKTSGGGIRLAIHGMGAAAASEAAQVLTGTFNIWLPVAAAALAAAAPRIQEGFSQHGTYRKTRAALGEMVGTPRSER